MEFLECGVEFNQLNKLNELNKLNIRLRSKDNEAKCSRCGRIYEKQDRQIKGKEIIKMQTREQLIDKIKSLPEDKLDEIADFVEFMETKGKAQSALAEYGMDDYLNQLSAYEEMLAAGKIKWR